MFNRRDFLRSMFGTAAVTLPSLKNDGLERVFSALASVDGRCPEEVASDEDFWFQIQQAFTLDRTIINLNNGGVCPSPRVVLDAQIRMLEFSNQAPVYHMWRILEPETVDEMLRIAHPEEGLALLWWSSGGAWMGHGGNFYGSTARFDLDRSRDLGLVILSNVSAQGAVQPGGEIYDLVRHYARAQNLVCPATPSPSCASGSQAR